MALRPPASSCWQLGFGVLCCPLVAAQGRAGPRLGPHAGRSSLWEAAGSVLPAPLLAWVIGEVLSPGTGAGAAVAGRVSPSSPAPGKALRALVSTSVPEEATVQGCGL